MHQLRASVANFRVKGSLSTRGAAPSEINSGVGMLVTGAQGDGVAGGWVAGGPSHPQWRPLVVHRDRPRVCPPWACEGATECMHTLPLFLYNIR